MMVSSVNCRRCRLPFHASEAHLGEDRVCLACALSAARVPLGPQHLQCRWYRDRRGEFQSKWTRVATPSASASVQTANHAEASEAARRVATAELWLKVVVHVAGFAALAAAPAVAMLLTHLSDQLRLVP
jgi:hypothetical protein